MQLCRWGCASDVFDGCDRDPHVLVVHEVQDPKVSGRLFRIITVNLYADETAWLDAVRDRLRRKGLTKVTRSEVARLAVTCLRRQLEGYTDAELVNFFLHELVVDAGGNAESP